MWKGLGGKGTELKRKTLKNIKPLWICLFFLPASLVCHRVDCKLCGCRRAAFCPPLILSAVCTQVMPIRYGGSQKPLALESVSVLLAQPLRWRGWMLVKKCVPYMSTQTVLILLDHFSPRRTLWWMLVLPCSWRVGLEFSCAFPRIPPYLRFLCHCSHSSPSCSYLDLLGSMPSSFGLDLGDSALSVFRGKWKV